ncbi:MAG: selenocysteine-specific translation elongation factor [Clostridia bacterium]|jgi:selenocysteine-specific elongation factor|nr:selenocysteine-specific translation elongation factor [Clostridia bacterium]MDH7573380.1 selenocysteine-specific translation elongation factor [Clostridia bacterium]
MGFLVVGTAGHVDHGKTVLVRALTGVDTDRLKEEKERGISIELGFAPLRLPNGQVAGLVDVPGHERFIRQMLAGAAGIDLVLLVVAADEGVRPQTREHLAIVDLLGVQAGIITLTKKDLVTPEWLELVAEEVREAVKGTVLAEAPMVAVSALTGEGLPELLDLLAEQAEKVIPRQPTGPARLPIDRVFSVRGFGTVVTGTLWSGSLRTDQTVVILPQELSTRLRQLQVHNRRVGEAYAGQRVACNLAGIEVGDVKRGSVVVSPGAFRATPRLDSELKLLSDAGRELRHGQRVRFYLGTAEVTGRVLLLDREELLPGETGLAQLVLEEPVVAARGDRFVLRSMSPLITLGGGWILDPYAPRHKRHRAEVVAALRAAGQALPQERVLGLLTRRRWGLPLDELALLAGLEAADAAAVVEDLAAQDLVVVLAYEGGQYVADRARVTRWEEEVDALLGEFHRQYPLRPGMPKEELRTRLFGRLPARAYSGLLEYWCGRGRVKDQGGYVARPDFTPSPSGAQSQTLEALLTAFREGRWQPPAPEEVFARLGVKPEEGHELLHYLVQQGELVRVGEGLYFSRQAVAEARERIADLIRTRGPVELAAVRDLLGSSRKYVLPLMEYFDQIHLTRRVGDKRVLYSDRA